MSGRRIRDPRLIGRPWFPAILERGIVHLHWALLHARPGPGPKTLFILSHQRSGSSLLVHCLNTNPAVIGYGETLIHYASARDLRRLPSMIMKATRKPVLSQRWVTDKLLYDELLEDASLLRSPSVYAIFLVREAGAALASLIRAPTLEGWPQRPEANRDYVDQEACEGYYSARLATLEGYARALDDRRRSLFLTHEDLIDRTDRVFAALESLLGVRGGFSERYETLRTTGRPGFGDVSGEIRSGRVQRCVQHPPTEVRPDLMARGDRAFRRCCETLTRHCAVPPGEAVGSGDQAP